MKAVQEYTESRKSSGGAEKKNLLKIRKRGEQTALQNTKTHTLNSGEKYAPKEKEHVKIRKQTPVHHMYM